jgi:hypothetical protein
METAVLNRPSLAEALDCEDESLVIEGFMDRYNVSEDEARSIFEETKKWLWLSAQTDESEHVSLGIDKPLLVIDEMWHNFLMYTRVYHRFCMDKLKKFIHHEPTPKAEKIKRQQRVAENPEKEYKKWKESYYQQLSFIYDHLGPETVIKWYEELPTKYTPEYLSSIKR